MGYGYFLTEVFKHFQIPLGIGNVGTVKQTISEHTLFECECIEGRGLPKIKMAQLLEDQDQLKHEIEQLAVRLSSKVEAYKKSRWLNFLRTWISLSMRLKNSLCG